MHHKHALPVEDCCCMEQKLNWLSCIQIHRQNSMNHYSYFQFYGGGRATLTREDKIELLGKCGGKEFVGTFLQICIPIGSGHVIARSCYSNTKVGGVINTTMEERFVFVTDWYDPHAAFVRKYQLLYYPADNTCEMVDVKNRRLFLKRSKCENISLSDLFIGSTINILSRHLTITEFGDEYTTRKLKLKKEKTLAIVKPDCISKLSAIFSLALSKGFVVCQAKTLQLTQRDAETFYAEHRGKPIFPKLITFMTEGPIAAFELMGVDAVSQWRLLLGPTDSAVARQEAPNSIRAQFGTDDTRNACHGSDSPESAKREADFFFGSRTHGRNTATFANCSLCIIKPHAVKEGIAGRILEEIEASGLHINCLEMFNVEKANAEEFYEVYKGVVREYYSMVEELCSGPCIALEITSRDDDVHQRLRELAGPADPEIARHLRPKTLRAKFGSDKIKNAVHCTDLFEDCVLEVEYFFKILDCN